MSPEIQKAIESMDVTTLQWSNDPPLLTRFKMVGSIGHILMTRTVGEIETTLFRELLARAEYEMCVPDVTVVSQFDSLSRDVV